MKSVFNGFRLGATVGGNPVLRALFVGLITLAAAATLASGEPTLVHHGHSGEVERSVDKRPRAGDPDEPDYHRFKSFSYQWLEVQGHPDAKVTRLLNQRLRELGAPAELPVALPGRPRRPDDESPADDYLTIAHARIQAGTLTLVIDTGWRNADAPKHELGSVVHHFDMATGRELTFADFFPRQHWPAVDKEFRRVLDAFNDENVYYYPDEFTGLSADTQGYFAKGTYRLLIRSSYGSSAVESAHPFLEIPAGILTPWLTPRARAILSGPTSDGRQSQETGREYFAVSPEY